METECKENDSPASADRGSNKGATIGSAIGHAIGVGVDVLVGSIAGGIAAGKESKSKNASRSAELGAPGKGMREAINVGVDVVVGAVAGGMAAGRNGAAGKRATDAIDPSVEHAFWRNEFANRPYFTHGTPYEEYGPAFQFGWESRTKHKGKSFKEIEPQLAREWEVRRGQSRLSWNDANAAAQDAWEHAENAPDGTCCRSI